MPSKKQYNLVNDDAYDCRIPLYNEEAFQHGITFHAKYIGSLDVPRPTSRVEIVAAMRRIRYEFKAKSVKKKKVSLTVSVDGVKVVVRNKRKANQWPWDENKLVVMHHPVYRIFYVSHDSQDLKIFSYIARDGGTNAFKCNVFKSKKKSQAMRIVRTVGQAFEVCHKLSLALASSSSACSPVQYDMEDSSYPDHSHKGDGASEPNSCDIQAEEFLSKQQDVPPSVSEDKESTAPSIKISIEQQRSKVGANPESASSEDMSPHFIQQIQSLKHQLEEQNQQMQVVTSQLRLLKDQLASETSARLQTQAENQHLNAYNRELLEHITKLIHHFHEVERQYHTDGKSNIRLLPEPLPLPKITSKGNIQSSASDVDSVRKRYYDSPTSRSVPDGFSMSVTQSIDQETESSNASHQFSAPSVTFFSASESPRLGSRRSPTIGLSHPGSPSPHSFSIDPDSVFKSPSPLTVSLKQSRMESNNSVKNSQAPYPNHSEKDYFSRDQSSYFPVIPGTSSDFSKGSSTEYSQYSARSSTMSDEKKEPASSAFNDSYSTLEPHSFFHRSTLNSFNGAKHENASYSCHESQSEQKYPAISANNNKAHLTAHANQNSFQLKSLPHNNHVTNSSSTNDSFIAQVARDLAKMNVTDKELPLYSESTFTPLFKS